MKVRFYLKRAGAKRETAIFAVANYGGHSLKVYTGEAIHPKFWNAKTQTAKSTPAFPESPEFNQRLVNIRATINRVYLRYVNDNDNQHPEPQQLREHIENAIKGKGKQTFLSYFEEFVNRTLNGQRLDPKSQKPIRHSVGKGYQTTFNHLQGFAANWHRELSFASIDLEFHKDFTEYLAAPPRRLSANTIGSNFQRLKAVLAEATEKGLNSNMTYKSRYFVKQAEEASTIYLNEAELDEIEQLDLSDQPRLDNARDLFLIGCYTGLRFSDFSALSLEKIKDGFIRVTQVKTAVPVVIPIHSVVSKIIEKRGGNLPRSISNEKLNQYIKEVAQLCPSLVKPETKSITRGGVKTSLTVPKWQLVTTHTARRSFATNEFLAGTPTLTLMSITGHRTEKAFLKYIRVNKEEHAENMAKLWKRRSRLKAV